MQDYEIDSLIERIKKEVVEEILYSLRLEISETCISLKYNGDYIPFRKSEDGYYELENKKTISTINI